MSAEQHNREVDLSELGIQAGSAGDWMKTRQLLQNP